MSASRFSLDSNVLFYALDKDAGAKHARAREILERSPKRDCVLTVQALAEFYFAVIRKQVARATDAANQARDWIDLFAVVAADTNALVGAMSSVQTRKLAFWDALLLATALSAGCGFLLSEDMQDGATIHGLKIVNPFGGPVLPAEIRRLLGME